MADHFLSKITVAPADLVTAGDRPVLERHAELRALLAERAGPEVAAMFAEPLVSRGNDAAPPTVSWYTEAEGEARPLSALPPGERDRAERYLADHLRPLRVLAEDPATSDLALGVLSVPGGDDILVVGGKPVIVNWGLLPGGDGANAGSRPAHYADTLGRFLPLTPPVPGTTHTAPHPPTAAAALGAGAAAGTVAGTATAETGGETGAEGRPDRLRVITPLAWVPLLVLLILAGAILAWLLLPGTRLFHTGDTRPVITDQAALDAARANNADMRARALLLQEAIDGAVCRADGVLVVPGGLTPEGLTPPPLGTEPERRAGAAPDALLPNDAQRVVVPNRGDGETGETTLLQLIEARTVLVIARGTASKTTTGSGFVIGPGLVVTNQHVIASAQGEGGQIVVTGAALAEPQQADLLKVMGPLQDTGGDFALLRIGDTSLPPFIVHRPTGSLKLTNVIAAGYPGDVLELDAAFKALKSGDMTAVPGLTVTDGTVNTEQQIGPATHMLMHSAPLSEGNSGGPLVDMCGRLVGVNSFVKQGSMQNRGYALTTGDLLAFLNGTPAAPEIVSEACAPLIVRPQVATVPASDPGTDPETDPEPAEN
ncbi:trypsin-like peptidase domain-containing protein [Pukyongiella litopenaei]|uniref:Trypsin-like peptidase domain-containing protein n=1 Tax=Pukyongiella litopenaei TaxID=2605946 RepID=A0A2S0MMN1_9RHOB|nr:trypsin-like peptidase domain-containing protein [Pukyongiella litopenaei]AVO37011.1 trypsin-like peptidase domain-containing protein [Pukyongiella litopenaei]